MGTMLRQDEAILADLMPGDVGTTCCAYQLLSSCRFSMMWLQAMQMPFTLDLAALYQTIWAQMKMYIKQMAWHWQSRNILPRDNSSLG